MGRVFACLMILAGLVCPAAACLNDSELPNHEREFRSQYARSGTPPATRSNDSVRYWLVAGTGSVLLAGGVAVALFGGRTRS